MEAIAKTKYLKGSPRKARLVIDMIRGRNVSQALAILKFTDKRATDPIEKTLRSAIANATFLAEKQNIAIDPDDLFVKSCYVDMGPHKNRRRLRPAPQGRAYREQRHYCHITILVSSDKPAEEAKNISVKEKTSGEKKSKGAASKSSSATQAPDASKKAGSVKEDKKKADKKAKSDEATAEEAVTQTAAPAEETKSPKATEASRAVETEEAKGDAEAADVKDAESQTPAERNEPKRADEAQLDTNEELERQ
jgi:large subunit ribosomal protein L22